MQWEGLRFARDWGQREHTKKKTLYNIQNADKTKTIKEYSTQCSLFTFVVIQSLQVVVPDRIPWRV